MRRASQSISQTPSRAGRSTRGGIGGISAILLLRKLFQLVVVIAVAVTGYRLARGLSLTSIETYCPFGGLEAAWSFVTQRSFSCVTGERNLSLFLALLGLTLVARKSFCSWICPFGTVSEWIGSLAGRLRRGSHAGLIEPPRRIDSRLRWLRLPMLVLILYFTYRTGELIFRGFDPYYVLFSFHGHDVRLWSYAVLAVVLAAAAVVPMAWCRYLCPLGIVLWPFSRLAVLRLRRAAEHCTACGSCDATCPHGIEVSRAREIRSGECTLCLECVGSCPAGAALELRVRGVER